MSASKDKINRKQQIEAGTDKRTKAAAEEAAKRRKTNITYTVVAVILVIFFAFIFTYNSTFPTRHTTAVTIDGEEYTAAQLNYYYSNAYTNFYNNYGAYISYGLFFDTSTSLGDQMYAEDVTWRDFFIQSAVDNMTQIQILNDAAEAAGFTLSEEDQASYESTIESLENSWADLGYSSLKQYLNINFGKGVDMDMVKEELYRTQVASAYSQYLYDSYSYTSEELAAYYAEHADENDVISYVYAVDYDGVMDTDAAAAELNGTDELTFTSYMETNYPDVSVSSLSYDGQNLPTGYSEWLLDAARVPGDATAVEVEGYNYVVMFLDRNTNDYHPADFRHILVKAEDTDGDGAFSEEEIAAAAEEAQAIYDEWKAGAATEDSFAELANTYSDDGGSNTTGGLYESVSEARQPGDTEVISYDGSNYTGTHVVFYVGEDDAPYSETLADTAMRTDAYNTWLQEQVDAANVTTSHLNLCGKNH